MTLTPSGLRALSLYALGLDRLGVFDIGPIEGLVGLRTAMANGSIVVPPGADDGSTDDQGTPTGGAGDAPVQVQADVIRWGVVVDDSPVLVQIAGDTTGSPVAMKNTAYTPVVDDVVVLLKVGDTWAILAALEAT